MKNGAMWPKGSANGEPGVTAKTAAKVEAWTTYPKSREKGDALREAAGKMAAVAGTGLDGVRGAIGAVGKACKSCHEAFRIPKDQM